MFMQVLSHAALDYYLYIYQARFDLYKRVNESEFDPEFYFKLCITTFKFCKANEIYTV